MFPCIPNKLINAKLTIARSVQCVPVRAQLVRSVCNTEDKARAACISGPNPKTDCSTYSRQCTIKLINHIPNALE